MDKCPQCGIKGEWLMPHKVTLMVEGEMRVKKKIVKAKVAHSPGGHGCMKHQIVEFKKTVATYSGIASEFQRRITELEVAMDSLVRIKAAADGGQALAGNQGQALDGYSELANYRAVIEAHVNA